MPEGGRGQVLTAPSLPRLPLHLLLPVHGQAEGIVGRSNVLEVVHALYHGVPGGVPHLPLHLPLLLLHPARYEAGTGCWTSRRAPGLILTGQGLQTRAPVVLLVAAHPGAGTEAAAAVLADEVLHVTVDRQLVALQAVTALEGEVTLVTRERSQLEEIDSVDRAW